VTSASPIDIYPGDSSQVTVTFDNLGSNMVTSARALAFTRGLEAKWAGSDQYIGSIAGHASGKAVFTLEAPKNLKSGNYPLEVRLEYVSSNKSNGWQEFSFTVPVKPKAEFSAEPANGALLPGQKKEVQLQLANTGTDEARKLQVRIKPLFPFSTDGTVRYVESLQPGEAANLTYLITVDKEAMAGGQLLSLQVDFEDKYGKKHSDSADFSMPVRMPTLVDDVLGLWYVEIPVALVVAYLLLRGRKRKATA
jgi:hypothetical protein